MQINYENNFYKFSNTLQHPFIYFVMPENKCFVMLPLCERERETMQQQRDVRLTR